MKISLSLSMIAILLSLPLSTFAKTDWLYIHKGELFTDHALVERNDSLYKGELWLIETGIGCMIWMQDNKWALFDTGYGTFLDGISDKLIIPDSYSNRECKIWDAFNIDDWEYKLYGYEKDQFLTAIALLGDISSPSTRSSASSYSISTPSASHNTTTSCPSHSSKSSSDQTKCTCDIGYKIDKSKTKCIKNSPKENDKICQASFGKNSKWSKEYSDAGGPTCSCKNKYEWNKKQTSCVKSKKS